MPHIKELFTRFEETAYSHTYNVYPSESIDIDEPTVVYLLKYEEKAPLFEVNDKPIRLHSKEIIDIEVSELPKINYLYLLSPDDKKNYILSCLPIRECQPLENDFTIAFGDEFVERNKGRRMNRLESYLHDNLVFDGGKYSFLFLQVYANGPQWQILGPDVVASGVRNVDKDVIGKTTKPNKTSKVRFPNDYYNFSALSVRCYKKIVFKNESQIKVSLERLSNLDQKGQSLLKLWESYAELEVKRSTDMAEKLGSIHFKKIRSLVDRQVEVELLVNPEDENLLVELARTGALFEVSMDENKLLFKLMRYTASNKKARFEDELFKMPEYGVMNLSAIGDLVIKKRRDYALNKLREQTSPLLAFLWEAMEDKPTLKTRKAGRLIISDSTRDFVKKQFGVKLTDDQENAVNYALQTPDIMAIQGPPGTGKTTVVSAICHRLVELAEKEKGDKTGKPKLILASAFQNDTVEHIASKIYTEGLPTVKLGKTSQTISATQQFIDNLEKSIDAELEKLSPDGIKYTVSERLKDIYNVHIAENNLEETCNRVTSLLKDCLFDHELAQQWIQLIEPKNQLDRKTIRILDRLQKISADMEDYQDIEYCHLASATLDKNCKDELTHVENVILDDMNGNKVPDRKTIDDFLDVRSRLIDKLGGNDTEMLTEEHLIDWLLQAIKKGKEYDLKTTSERKQVYYWSVLDELKETLKGNTNYIENAIRSYGVSVAATNQVSARLALELGNDMVRNVILEEAARSNPLDLIIPMTKATERIILLGDQMQLPHLLEQDIADAVVNTLDEEASIVEEKQELLKKSLFGIIFDNLKGIVPQRFIMLTKQFRMHPAIGSFISNTYYDGQLENGVTAKDRAHNLPDPWTNKAIAFVDVDGKSMGYEERGQSKSRKAEVTKVMNILDKIIQYDKNLSVGVITFYSKQVRELMRAAEKKGYTQLDREGNYIISPMYSTTTNGRERLRIGSVDSFQGKEFDVVILSTVRSNNTERKESNERKAFGFLLLENRLNVAFSRAIRLLITVGDGSMFNDDFAKNHVKGLYELYTHQTKLQYGVLIK
jgi:hypothetical protein